MAIYKNTPPIVTNGLVLHLDAGSRMSYPGSGTTWSDLSGNLNSGSLVNGPTFITNNQGAIQSDGTNDYVQVSNSATLNGTQSTVCVWFKNYGSSGTSGSLVIGKHDTAGSINGYTIVSNNSSGRIVAQIKGSTYLILTNPTSSAAPLNEWHNATLTYSSGVSHTFYVDNRLVSSGDCVSFSVASQPLRMMTSVDTYWNTLSGCVAVALIYNRVLSAAEVAQNYNALKSRFGLT